MIRVMVRAVIRAEPDATPYRRTDMSPTRHLTGRLAALAVAAALVAAMSGCGSGAAGDVATDAGGTTTSATPTPSPSLPTEAPKPPNLPDFPYADYSYTLGQLCFCATIDQRYRVTVVDGKVTEVTWATEGEGHEVGDPIDAPFLRLTIQDIIDRGNEPGLAEVKVDWPAGQAYPNSVYLDQMANVADEEVTWLISDVETG